MAQIGSLDWVHVFVDVPHAVAAQTRVFWSRALCWATGDPWGQHPEFTTLLPPDGDPYVHVQEVGDDDARVHPDIVVDDLDEARDQAVALGASAGTRAQAWQVMRSPGGLPFCLCRHPASGSRPPGTQHEGGWRSRLAKLCIDAPEQQFDRELVFWQQVTGWQSSRSSRPEYTDLLAPRPVPLRLLLQRLEPHDTGTTVRAHIDLGSDDIDAEARRLTTLGARHAERFDGWALMSDPAGLPFCVTASSPD
jgi:hypothetical protein